MKSKNTYSESELKEKAQSVFARYKTADKVFATTDGNVFLLQNRAELHAGEGRVIPIVRPLQNESVNKPEDQKMTAKEAIALIEAAESLEEIVQFADDDRKTVQQAYADKLEELGGPAKE